MQRLRQVSITTACGLAAVLLGTTAATAQANEPPSVQAYPFGTFGYDIVEGSGVTLDASQSSDPDGDALDYAWDLDGDGEFDDATGATPTLTVGDLGAIALPDYQNLTDGPVHWSFTVRVHDGHNTPVVGYAQVDVRNAAPTGSVAGPATLSEGSSGTLTVENATDVGPLDVSGLHYFFDLGGAETGAGSGLGTYQDGLGSPSIDFRVDDDGTYPMSGGVIDKDEAASAYPHELTVTNVAPTATLTSDGPVVEGSDAHVTFSDQLDPSNADTGSGFHYAFDIDGDGTWDVGDGTYGNGTDDPTIKVPTAVVPTDDDGTTTVRAAIIDKDDGVTIKTVDVVATNGAPAVAVTAPDATPIDTALAFRLTTADPSSVDEAGAFSYAVDWGDGQHQTIAGPATATATHTFATAGEHAVKVVATDKDGGTSAARTVTVTIPTRPASPAADQTATTPSGGGAVAAQSSAPLARILGASVAPRCLGASTRSFKLDYQLSSAAPVRISAQRVTGSTAWRTCPVTAKPVATGKAASLRPASLLAKGQKLTPGTYVLTVTVLDAAGQPQASRLVKFWVLKA